MAAGHVPGGQRARFRNDAGTLQQAPQIDDLLLADVVVSRGVERLGFCPQDHRRATVVVLVTVPTSALSPCRTLPFYVIARIGLAGQR